jgi:hypothetical protein
MPYTDATSSIVNQTIVPNRAILPSGDIYNSTASTSDMKQAQGSAAQVVSDTSDDPLRSIGMVTMIVVTILLTSMLSAALVLTLLLYAKHCVKPLKTSDSWGASRLSGQFAVINPPSI